MNKVKNANESIALNEMPRIRDHEKAMGEIHSITNQINMNS